jgi:putative transposase
MVEYDAEARRELIAAPTELTSPLNEQQSAIYTGHEQLEQNRREIAEQHHRDPIVAAVIQNFGLVIACLLPLLVSVFVIRQIQSQEPDHAAVVELLVLERVGGRTLFIEPGSAWENGFIESFNEKLRDELLNVDLFDTLLEAKVVIERWEVHYNTVRLHSSLG